MRRVGSLIGRIIKNPWVRRFASALLVGLMLIFTGVYVTQCQRFEERTTIVYNLLTEADSYATNGIYHDAIDIYNELLRQVSDSRQPEVYSHIKHNLGVCYYALAMTENTENKELNIRKSIIAYRDALIIRTFKDHPEQYAETQHNLGLAYWAFASILDIEENLNKAAAAFLEALRVYTPLRYPDQYADVNSYLEEVTRQLNS